MRPTVLIPSYRGGEYLRHALTSLLNQTIEYRLILLDTSGEGRAEVVFREFPLAFQHSVEFEHFPPHDDAGNAAGLHLLELWGGEGLACSLHDDDAFHPQRLEASVAYMEAHPEIDIAFCGQVPFTNTTPPGNRAIYPAPEKWAYTLESYRPICSASSMWGPARLTVPYPEEYTSGFEDVLMHARWQAAGLGIAVVPNSPHYYRRKHHGGPMGNSCAPRTVDSAMGMARVPVDVWAREIAMRDAEFEKLRTKTQDL